MQNAPPTRPQQRDLRDNLEQRLQAIRDVVVEALDSREHRPYTIKDKVMAIYMGAIRRDGMDFNLIGACIDIGVQFHQGERRENNLPYISHPLEVGYILCEIGVPSATIGAGILHDTGENERDSRFDELFGMDISAACRILEPWRWEISEIIKLVSKPDSYYLEGMTRLQIKGAAIRQIIMESGPLKSKAYAVKVADRLHNLLTLGSLKDKPSASAEERAATTIKSTELVLPLARDVDMAYRGMGSGLLTYPYMCYLVGQLRFNRPS